MGKNRAQFIVAVHIVLQQGDSVLLLKRQKTGYGDGLFSVPAGHVEFGESIIAAARRELEEETGLLVPESEFEQVHVMNRRNPKEGEDRIDFFFRVISWEGEPTNAEPDKCSELVWVSLDAVAEELIVPYIKFGLQAVAANQQYSCFTEP